MRRCFFVLLTLLLCTLAAGCQATPDAPIVIGKGDSQLEQRITSAESAPPPEDLPRDGERVRRTFSHKNAKLTVELDALVKLPDVFTMPAAKVEPYVYTDADAGRILEHFAGGARFFFVGEGDWDIEQRAYHDASARLLEYVRANPPEYDAEQIAELAQNELGHARETLLASSPAHDFPDSPRAFALHGGYGGEAMLNGCWERDGLAYETWMNSTEHGSENLFRIERKDFAANAMLESLCPEMISRAPANAGDSVGGVSYAEALDIAKDAVRAVLDEPAMMYDAAAVVYPEEYGGGYFSFAFGHEVNGAVLERYGSIALDDGRGSFADVWEYEDIAVMVDGRGLCAIRWNDPMKLTSSLSDSTPMLSFGDIMNCFEKMVFVKNAWWEDSLDREITYEDGVAARADRCVVNVDKLTLALMRVQSGREYLLIPVWNFYGCMEYFDTEGKPAFREKPGADTKPKIVLTLNAIDGSVIDVDKGY